MTTDRPAIENYLMDMDGVLVHEERLIPGADLFVKRLQQTGHRFLLLTNNSIYTPRDLAARLALTGLEVPESSIWTSALATARFLDTQRPQGTAYVIGEAGLTTALHQVGYVADPDHKDREVARNTHRPKRGLAAKPGCHRIGRQPQERKLVLRVSLEPRIELGDRLDVLVRQQHPERRAVGPERHREDADRADPGAA